MASSYISKNLPSEFLKTQKHLIGNWDGKKKNLLLFRMILNQFLIDGGECVRNQK